MADHSLPTLTTNYTEVLSDLKGRIDDALKFLDPATTTPTNIPANAIRFNSSAGRWEKWNGTAWSSLISTYQVNVATASALATARSITISGDMAWTVNFDGSANVTASGTLANSGVTAGTYKSVTVDAKGRVTGGTNPASLSGYGIIDAYTKTEIDTFKNNYALLASPTFTGTVTLPSTTSVGNVSSTELGYLDGASSNIQSQLNSISSSVSTKISASNYASTDGTIGGTMKARVDGTTLYITTDGSNA